MSEKNIAKVQNDSWYREKNEKQQDVISQHTDKPHKTTGGGGTKCSNSGHI